MRWVLGLVGTGIDGAPISVNIMEFDRPDCLEDIASLGLTLAEGSSYLRSFNRKSSPRKSAATRCCGRPVVPATGDAM